MIKRRGIVNPGAAWHVEQYDKANELHRRYGLANDIRNMDMAMGKSAAHYLSYMQSKIAGIPNPSHKVPWIPIAVIIGLGLLIWKNRNNT